MWYKNSEVTTLKNLLSKVTNILLNPITWLVVVSVVVKLLI